MSEPAPLEKTLAWLLPTAVAALVAAFFLLMAWDRGPWSLAFRAEHPLVLAAIAVTLIVLAPATVLTYHALASKRERRRLHRRET